MKQQPKLPQFYVIKRDETNHLWKKYIDWLNQKSKNSFGYSSYEYIGYDYHPIAATNGYDNMEAFRNNPEIITLEYWNECVNGEAEAFERLNKIWGDDEDGQYEKLYNKTMTELEKIQNIHIKFWQGRR